MRRVILAAVLCLGASPVLGQGYTINGVWLDQQTAFGLYAMGLPPGHYWVGPDGSFGIVGFAQPLGVIGPQGFVPMGAMPGGGGAAQGGGNFTSGGPVLGGSGQVNPDGSSSYVNPDMGTSFGADGGGCYYVGDWSNC